MRTIFKIRTVQWNIGGGKTKEPQGPAQGPYFKDDLGYIAEMLKTLKADIVTLQETHSGSNSSQAEILSQLTGLPYFINDSYDHSHLEENQELGQSILSRWPLEKHSFILFHNPQAKTIGPDGEKWISHNKGVSSCAVKIGKMELRILTLHLIPFRKFNIDPLDKSLENLRDDITGKIKSRGKFILQGDFNYNNSSLKKFLPHLFQEQVQEVCLSGPTTPKGRKYDHVVYRGLRHLSSRVKLDALTDHYPVYSEFETLNAV